MLVIAAMNLKQMATWLWKTGRTSPIFTFEFVNMVKKRRELPRLQYFAGVCLQSEAAGMSGSLLRAWTPSGLGRVAGLIGRIPEIS
ncbi:hypothetical protein DOE73_15175 [Paenibacillus dendritiformis]|nr:hypothetical protein DOE73_15175 [Paenibacillus dendritiformis]